MPENGEKQAALAPSGVRAATSDRGYERHEPD